MLKGNCNGHIRASAAAGLGEIGGKEATPALITALQDWNVGPDAVRALNKIGWQPESIEDKIHYLVAKRSTRELMKEWEQGKQVLYKDYGGPDYDASMNALFALINIGEEETIPVLINKMGGIISAKIFFQSGNKELKDAAIDWATSSGWGPAILDENPFNDCGFRQIIYDALPEWRRWQR